MKRLLVGVLVVTSACMPGPGAAQDEAPGIGEPAVDGQFTFVVDAFTCGHTEVVNGLFRQEPTGEFCFLELTVTNTGEQGRTYHARAQRLKTYEGGLLTPSNEATLIVSPGVANEELNPGLSVTTTVVFDIADPDEVEFAQLRDAPLSQGVDVRLGQERG